MPASRPIFAMRFLVFAAAVAAAVADVSHLSGFFNAPASSYGVPQNSVTENFLRAVPTSPSPGLHLPAFEHQDFNTRISFSNPKQFSTISTTPAPTVDSGLVSSTTAASVAPVVSTTPAPGLSGDFQLGSRFTYTTPAPDLGLNSGFQNFVSSTPAPNVVLTSGSQELLSPQLNNFGFNAFPTQAPNLFSTPAPNLFSEFGGQDLFSQQLPNFGFNAFSTHAPNLFSTPAPNLFSTPAPNLFSTPAPNLFSTPAPNLFSTSGPLSSTTPSPLLDSGLNFGSGLNFQNQGFPNFPNGFPNFLNGFPNQGFPNGLNAYSTPLPSIGDGDELSSNGEENVHSLHSATSGGSLNDAFGVSSGPVLSAPSHEVEVSKHVYFFDAPEDPDPPRFRVNIAPVPPPKKNVKIVFIKAPTPPAPPPIRIAAPPQNQEKTLVYVLVKKPEEQQDIVIEPPPATAPTKPEIFFLRYKNQQEAEQAISQVQNEHSNAQTVSDTANGAGELIINREGPVTPFPVFNNYVQSTTTAAPPVNIGGPLLGSSFNARFVNPQLDNDINTNLISSGERTSSLFRTGGPVTVPTNPFGIFGTSTVAPFAPHTTYGPPVFKKK